MSQREVTIVGHNNTKVKITGQQEILSKARDNGKNILFGIFAQ